MNGAALRKLERDDLSYPELLDEVKEELAARRRHRELALERRTSQFFVGFIVAAALVAWVIWASGDDASRGHPWRWWEWLLSIPLGLVACAMLVGAAYAVAWWLAKSFNDRVDSRYRKRASQILLEARAHDEAFRPS